MAQPLYLELPLTGDWWLARGKSVGPQERETTSLQDICGGQGANCHNDTAACIQGIDFTIRKGNRQPGAERQLLKS